MTLKKSEATRTAIIQSAKQNFYQLGYKKTTISKIFNDIDIPAGVFTYYFKKKDLLVNAIYEEFFDAIEKRIIELYPTLKEPSLLKQMILSKIYYDIILNDENNARFYFEVIENDSNYRVNRSITSPIHKNYIDEFHLSLTDEQFEIICIMNAGARREFFMHYFSEEMHLSAYEVSDYLESIIPLLMHINIGAINGAMLQSAKIAKTIDICDLHFLI